MGAGITIVGGASSSSVGSNTNIPTSYARLYRDYFQGKQIVCHQYCQCSTCCKWRPFLIRKRTNPVKWLYGRLRCWVGYHDFSGQGTFKTCITLGLMSDQSFGYGVCVCDRCHQILAIKQCM